MKQVLAFGLSGQVGRALLALPAPFEGRITAVSRGLQPDLAGVNWRQGSLEQPPALPAGFDTIVSLGPLDAFALWFQHSNIAAGQVIALGSTSVHSRADSPDAAERALAARLKQSEVSLTAACRAQGASLQLLRPTMLYGAGGDNGLSQMVALARRHGFAALPLGARGLRQPVHVEDVATVVAGLLAKPPGTSFQIDLPGAQALPLSRVLQRSLATGAPGAYCFWLPPAVLRMGLVLAARLGWVSTGAAVFLGRVQRDQIFDGAPAAALVGWKPRGFMPEWRDFTPA